MGHRKIPTIYTITDLEGEEGLVVRFQAIKISKLRRLARIVEAEDSDLMQQLDEVFALLADGLVSWNLEDADGNEVPATRSGIEDQELPFIMSLLKRWMTEMTGVEEELGKDSSSGETFPGQPLTMEAL